jgi:DNA invertase Pin-like site-specific DNA recombinase
MNCVSYSRVSSIGQNAYNKGVSLQAQEQICAKFACENKLNIRSIYKEIHSAYNKVPKVLNEVVNKKKQIILCSSIDRFSRSKSIGIELANKAIKNKNQIIFIQENIVIKTPEEVCLLKKHLLNSENESSVISRRIKKSKTYLINNGMHPGGAIPYGYDVVNKRLVNNSYEQKVIEFIKLCKTDEISCVKLNTYMKQISNLDTYVDINCYDEDDKIINQLHECLNNQEIVNLLNDYNILKRGKLWGTRMIITAIKLYDPKVELGDTPLVGWNEIKTELSDIDLIVKKPPTPDIKIKNSKFTFESSKNNLMIDEMELISPYRIDRLNPKDIDLDINEDVGLNMQEDARMFQEFQEFKKFKKLMKINEN